MYAGSLARMRRMVSDCFRFEEAANYFRSSAEFVEILHRVPQDAWEIQRRTMNEIANRRDRWSIIAAKYAQAL
ncbi:MAG: hypothetical protein ABSA42_21370 [Terracidiphilus sp.]|jgi:hypothetical protein